MSICPTLNQVQRTYVNFDPTDPEHLKAFKMLVIGDDTPDRVLRQHPTLRFNLDLPFTNVRDMMIHMVTSQYMADQQAQMVNVS